MGLVEDDHALEGVAGGFVQPAREPGDDLLETRAPALAGGASQGRVGGEEDALVMGDFIARAHLRERDDVGLAAPERGPVAAGVFEELVGLGEPQRPAPSAQPLVEDDRGHLPALAAAGAVAEHPAPAQAHGGGVRDLAVVPRPGVPGHVLVRDALDGLPVRGHPHAGGEAPRVRLAREHDALEPGVGHGGSPGVSGRDRRAGGRRSLPRRPGPPRPGALRLRAAGDARGPR